MIHQLTSLPYTNLDSAIPDETVVVARFSVWQQNVRLLFVANLKLISMKRGPAAVWKMAEETGRVLP
jgi:hypothetical protein